MPPRKRPRPDERIGLKLTAAERSLLLDGLTGLPAEHEQAVRSTPPAQPVMLTLDDLDDLGGYIAAAVSHTPDSKIQRALGSIFERIRRLMDRRAAEADDQPLTVEQARSRIARDFSDLLGGKDPGVISFRFKPKGKSGETYPLKLTEHQRGSLVRYTRLPNRLKERLRQAGEGTQVIGFTRKELDTLNEELGQAAMFAPGPDKKRLVAVRRKVTEFFEAEHAPTFDVESSKPRRRAPAKKSDLLYQFKITLKDVKPPVWRRVQMRDGSLGDLHELIQIIMGWDNCHLHRFVIGGVQYGRPLPDDGDFGLEFKDETQVLLSEVVPKSGRRERILYEYDFGDGWRHEVLFEGFPPPEPRAKYPRCTEGRRACPPEDVGGAWGYAEFLEALADPQHERHGEFAEWAADFDPEKFSVEAVNEELREVW